MYILNLPKVNIYWVSMFRLKGPKGERGISVVLGATIVIAMFIAVFSTFLSEWVPREASQKEHEHMRGVEESFRELRATIADLQAGEFRSVDVNMGASYHIPLAPTSTEVGTLSVLPAAIHTVTISPSDDAYVDNNLPDDNFGLKDSLQVASWQDDNKISFLKFSLESLSRGITIMKAELWLYCSGFEPTEENVPDVRCFPVVNDDWDNSWDESTITWNNVPWDNIGAALDSLYVDGVGRLCWTVKDFVTRELLGDQLLSLGLMVKWENYDDNERYASFHSKEAVKKPYLEIMYTTGPPIWKQTDWMGGETPDPMPESDKWPDDYDMYYRGENENTDRQGEIRLENEVLAENVWIQTTKGDFESGSLDNLDTSTSPGDVMLDNLTVTFGNTSNTTSHGLRPYQYKTYLQRVDPGGEYAAPYDGVIIQWSWNPLASTTGAKFKMFRHVTGTVWTMVGQNGPVNLGPGSETFDLDPSEYIPVKAGDRIGVYTGTGRTYWTTVSGYYASRTDGDIQGTSAFTEHLEPRRLPIEATLLYYKTEGTLVSSVHDTKGLTNWRKISWGETLPPGTNITLQTRAGMDEDPDPENWTNWSQPYTKPTGALLNLPISRYIQYKVNFSTTDTAHTPTLHWVKIEYITNPIYKPAGQLESSVYDAGASVDWRTITWEDNTPSLEEENKSVENEPDPLVDWSPPVGENLSPFWHAQAQDNIYENIAEELRRPWWDRSWACRRLVTVTNGGNALENYQVEIGVDYDDNMLPNFDDLHFIDNDNVTELSHWIENYNLGENAIVWVRVPSIPASGNKTFYMYYGNPGARPASDFSDTFPNSLIIDDTARTLGGVQRYDWVEIRNRGFLVIQSENILELFARRIIVRENSYIYAIGSGYPGGPTNRWRGQQLNGTSYDGTPGTGGGTGGYALGSSDGPGGGGGGYAGSGGGGGGARGPNDYPGVGGSTFGSPSDNSVFMGSGGGSGGLSQGAPQNDPWNVGGAGGAGGGVIQLNAGIIDIFGIITADGGEGARGMSDRTNAGSGGGGGGSGGTILIEGNEIIITGTLSANGGNGGARARYDPDPDDPLPYGGAGGGGGGGRIKVFYDEILENAGSTYSVDGGDSGGPSYGSPAAQPGASGTVHTGIISYPEPTASVGPEELELELVGELYYLNWEHRITGIELGYENYMFHIRGYSDNDGENIGVYIWKSKTDSWFLIDNLPKAPPDDPITFSIPPENLNDYLVGDNLSIGYLDSTGDNTRTVIHIDYCIFESPGQFSTGVIVKTRTGDTADVSDNTWSVWQPTTNGGDVPSPSARYIQYRVELWTESGKLSPVFEEITINHVKDTEYGIVGYSSGHVFYPDQAYVYEGGSVILTQAKVNLTVLDPMVIINVLENEDNNIKVYANFWIIENEMASITSTGTRTIRVFCVNSSTTVTPVEGPNRENVVLKVLSPYGDVWGEYLAKEKERLEAMGITADFDEGTLTLTIMGKENAGVNDIYYYEQVKEIEVELV